MIMMTAMTVKASTKWQSVSASQLSKDAHQTMMPVKVCTEKSKGDFTFKVH